MAEKETPKGASPAKLTSRYERGAQESGAKRTLISHHWIVLKESTQKLLRTPFSTIINCTVIGIALALPAFLLLLINDIQRVVAQIDKDPHITLYLQQNMDEQKSLELLTKVRSQADIPEATLITRSQALDELSEHLSGIQAAVALLGENPLPNVIVATPSDILNSADAIEQLRQHLSSLPGVESAEIDLTWVKRLFAFTRLIHHTVLILGLLLAFAVILVVGNTIRLLIDARSEEIAVIKLVGGTDAFIRRPLLYSGLLIGLGGGLIAALLIEFTTWWLNSPVQGVAELYASNFTLNGLDSLAFGLLWLTSAALGWLGSRLAVGRHIAQIEP